MLTLNLFGAGQARFQNQPLDGFPRQQCTHLLCYLLLHRAYVHNREQLAAVFWGDYPTGVSRKYLSQSIWRLRQLIGSVGASPDRYLLIDKSTIRFQVESDYWLDTELFESLVSPLLTSQIASLSTQQATQLENAIDLYTGDLLVGVFDDWCLSERERLSLLHSNAMMKLLCHYESVKACERGLACGERILLYDNTRESVHRQLMKLYWHQGDRSSALAQYKRCEQILQDELGIGPMEETVTLYHMMLHNCFSSEEQQDIPTSTKKLSGNRTPIQLIEDEQNSGASIQEALRRLTRLHLVMQKTSSEIQQIEQIIRRVLTSNK